jgi:oligopeptide transport system substrate-binding protein
LRIRGIAAAAGGLAVASALVLSGCAAGGGSGDKPAGDPNAIIVANNTEPQNPLIPSNTNEVGGGKIVNNIMAGLVYYDAEGAPHNDVAESIETTDSQHYTVKIRDGLKFTNGDPVDAASFVDAWDWAATLSNAALNSYFFSEIEGFSWDEDSHIKGQGLNIVDDLTFTIDLTGKYSDYPLRLGYTAYFPMPKAAFDDLEAFGQNPIGNGPYMFDGPDAWKHNESISLVVNPDYDGPRKPANGGINFKIYGSQEAEYAELLGDNLDVLDGIAQSSLTSFEADLGDRAINQPAAIFQSLTMPSSLDRFADKDAYKHLVGEEGLLRKQAISMAINRAEITEVIFNNTRFPAHDFTSPVIAGYSEDVPGSEVLDFNVDKAKDLWAQADAISPWEGTFTIAYNSDGGHQAWVDAVANQLKNNLGIDAAGVPYAAFKEIRSKVSANEEGLKVITDSSWRSGWQADYPGLFNFLGPLYGTGAGSNDGDYSNADFDELLAKGSAADNIDDANKYYQEAQEILFKELPALPLWYSSIQGGFSTKVDNVKFGWDSWPIYYEVTKKAEK